MYLNKKAIIFTLDALLALLLAISFFTYISFYFSDVADPLYSDIGLYSVTNDALTVLEKTGTLANVVRNSDITELQTYLDVMPIQLCGNITIYNLANVRLFSAKRTSCTSPEKNVIVRKVFVSDFIPYLTTMEAWYFE